ncbi:hypothetical protein V6N12_062170 [Hibiscus sabdariffa]|uniref:Uncharacterized protein n=1 Tax=Hibiscus sabdariffa TaxID=183260 RepID=A0ABR2F827_9ROSI
MHSHSYASYRMLWELIGGLLGLFAVDFTIWCIEYRYYVFGTGTLISVSVLMNQYRPILSDDNSTTIGIESYLMGKTFTLDAQIIANHLGLDNEGVEDENAILPNLIHPRTSAFSLDAHDRFLHLMITWFFRPSGEKFSTIRGIDVFWIHFFQNNVRINLAQIIFADIVYIVNHRLTKYVKSFVYATVLSHILVKEGIDCSLDLECPLTHPINAKSLRKSKFQLVDGEWIRDPKAQEGDGDEDQAPPMAAPPVAAPQVSVELIQGLFHDHNANINARFNSMEARMSAFETRFKNQEDYITSIETQFKSQDDHITRMEMSLDAFHLEWRTQTFPPSTDNGDDDEIDDDSLAP